MGRKMEYNGQVVTVYEHIILRNLWEYYILDNNNEDIRLAIVMGFETEMGDVSMSEIKPFVISRTKVTNKTQIMPVAGGKWIEE
jgi:hypothetical protein